MKYVFNKKNYLLIIGIMAFVITGWAQPCTPDTSYNVPGIYPDTLPNGYDGQPYSAIIDFKVLKDTIILSFPTVVDSLKILGMEGLPTGFTWSCNISNCSFLGGENGCAEIVGIPDTSLIATWPLKLITKTWAIINGTTPLVQIDTITNFFITICTSDSNCTGDTLSGMENAGLIQTPLSFEVYPNPVFGSSIIEVIIDHADKGLLEITDMFGRRMMTRNMYLYQGINKISLDLSGLNIGTYFISIRTENGSSIKKILVSEE